MRFERLVIEAGSNTVSLNLHPRLTVISGLGKVEREGLAGELITALGSSRPGVHTELVDDNGRRLAVFRPDGGRHRVVDLERSEDVTDEFVGPEGGVDLLTHAGLDLQAARRSMRLNRTDLETNAKGDDLIRRLAQLDQTELWSAAARVRVTDDELSKEAEAAGTAPEDADVVERIERRHLALEAAAETHSRLRRNALLVGGGACVIGVPVVVVNPAKSLPVMIIGVIATLLAHVYRRRLQRAQKDEQVALEEAGAESYLGFQMQRVNGLLSSESGRRRLMDAAEDHRNAAARWAAVAGDISVDWVLDHHDEITAAARLQQEVSSLSAVTSADLSSSGNLAAELAHALVGRLATVRHLSEGGESFPLIVDDAFDGIDQAVKPSLLDLLARTAGPPQVVYLTEDDDVASWARMEALTGKLSILEPTPAAEVTTTSSEPDPHVAA